MWGLGWSWGNGSMDKALMVQKWGPEWAWMSRTYINMGHGWQPPEIPGLSQQTADPLSKLAGDFWIRSRDSSSINREQEERTEAEFAHMHVCIFPCVPDMGKPINPCTLCSHLQINEWEEATDGICASENILENTNGISFPCHIRLPCWYCVKASIPQWVVVVVV